MAAAHGSVTRYDNWQCRCEECREAKTESGRRYRQTLAGKLLRSKINRAHSRAYRRLAKLYPDDFRRLYREEMDRMGLLEVVGETEPFSRLLIEERRNAV